MVRRYACFVVFAILAVIISAASARSQSPAINLDTEYEIISLTLLADRALTLPLTVLASEYSREHHVSVTVTFAPDFEQTLAIEEGVPADVFVSAHPKSLQQLQQRGLFDVYSITPLAEARLKLVSAEAYPHRLKTFSIEALKALQKQDPEFLIALTNAAATAEGYFADQALKKLRGGGLFMYGHQVEFQNTEDVRAFVGQGRGFGIMFRSDIVQDDGLVPQADIPADWHEPIVFNGVALAGSAMHSARKFLDYLTSPPAQRVFIKYGLYPPKQALPAPAAPQHSR